MLKANLILFLFLLSCVNIQAANAHIYGRFLKSGATEKGPVLKSEPKIKVRVQKSLKSVFITGTDLKRKFHPNNTMKLFKGRKAIKFNCRNLKKASSFQKPTLLASLGSSTGLISLSKDKYKGLLHVVTSSENDSCDVVHETPLDTYISSLLSREMNSAWPVEALKAQAIAARSYAIHKMRSGQVKKEAGHETYYHLESSEKHQVSGNYFDANLNTEMATEMTKGMILSDSSGKVAPVFFHAKCGGKTLRPDQVWKNNVKNYQSVMCPFCKDHGSRDYDNTFSLLRVKKFLKWGIRKGLMTSKIKKMINEDLRLVPDKKFSRKFRFYLGDKMFSIKKSLFRRYFGRVKVPSNNFRVTLEGAGAGKVLFRIKGSGLGHGVGMCQLGALDLADRGWDYRQILTHYFPNHKLEKIY